METFDEIKERVLANCKPSTELESLLADIEKIPNPDWTWQVQTRVAVDPWLPMTGFIRYSVAQARASYWQEIMPDRVFRVKYTYPPPEDKIQQATELAVRYGGIDEVHHMAWVIDQMVRILTNCPWIELERKDPQGQLYVIDCRGESKEYLEIVRKARIGEDGPETYPWEIGIAP